MAAVHSRTSTIVDALKRLDISSVKCGGKKKCRLHIIGSDEMEVNCLLSSQPRWEEYENIFMAIIEKGFCSLQLVFIGPEMPISAANKEVSFAFTCKEAGEGIVDKTLTVCVSSKNDLYHEYWSKKDFTVDEVPHLVVLFNPGLWGYDSWLPTLRLFFAGKEFLSPTKSEKDNELVALPIYYVITSFTWEESEVDYDAMFDYYTQLKETLPSDSIALQYNLTWVWDCEVNPNKSTEPCPVVRTTCAPNTVYVDNYAWQCICMNKC